MAPKTPKSAKRTEKEPLEKDAEPKVGEALSLIDSPNMFMTGIDGLPPERNSAYACVDR